MKSKITPLVMRRAGALSSLCFGLYLLINGSYMSFKAELAQHLIARSWQSSMNQSTAQKPWPWADTTVAAKLTFENLNTHRFVMIDASGESLAFGPGFIPAASSNFATTGVAIAGHRDSHFAVIEKLQINDEITLERPGQRSTRFRVVAQRVIDTRYENLAPPALAELILITCWPFDELVPGGPLRYVIFAEEANLESVAQI